MVWTENLEATVDASHGLQRCRSVGHTPTPDRAEGESKEVMDGRIPDVFFKSLLGEMEHTPLHTIPLLCKLLPKNPDPHMERVLVWVQTPKRKKMKEGRPEF